MSQELVSMVATDSVTVLTLNHPETRNALSLEMRRSLVRGLYSALNDHKCLSIVLTGSGGAFCAGGDLRQQLSGDENEHESRLERLRVLQDIVRLIITGAKPIIGAVEGAAFGAGLSIAMACDYVIAAEKSSFCASFGRVGLVADAGLLWTLPMKVGLGRTKDLVLSARVIDGREALRLNLIEETTAAENILDIAVERARQLSANAPLAAAACKSILAHAPGSLESVFAFEMKEQPALSVSEDCAEGKIAFLEKRKPVFRNK